jgi:DNA replication protein DnaC
LIKQYCKELRIGMNIYNSYSKIIATDHADFLAQLLKMELDHRELVRKNRNLKSAGFDVIKTFENYEFEHIQIPSAINIEELKTGIFIDRLENLILYGPVGTGKSHMATAIGVAACSRGKKVKFYTTGSAVLDGHCMEYFLRRVVLRRRKENMVYGTLKFMRLWKHWNLRRSMRLSSSILKA